MSENTETATHTSDEVPTPEEIAAHDAHIDRLSANIAEAFNECLSDLGGFIPVDAVLLGAMRLIAFGAAKHGLDIEVVVENLRRVHTATVVALKAGAAGEPDAETSAEPAPEAP